MSVTLSLATSPCRRATTGGKGNAGMFIERDPRICAAGVVSNQPNEKLADGLQHYLMQEHADALKRDAEIPPPKPPPLPPLRRPRPLDMRYAMRGYVAQLINPPLKSKIALLADNMRETSYASYWNKVLGVGPDKVTYLPDGFDVEGTTMGDKTADHGRLYDLVMPKEPMSANTVPREAGVQTDRGYCRPAFNPDLIYGHRTGVDFRGRSARCCLTDDDVLVGRGEIQVITSSETDMAALNKPALGTVLTPNDNISCVPKGFAFGLSKKPDNLPECLTTCDLNPGSKFFKSCLGRLNTLRRVLAKKVPTTFFAKFYLELKFFDKEKTGWLPKEVVYQQCALRYIRFDPAFLEPLFAAWQAFDGKHIEYKTFVFVLNYRESSPELPRVEDVDPKCLFFTTTYREMIKPLPPNTSRMAGLPSGRYFDMDYPVTPIRYCKADRANLSMETDMRACISPSVYTLAHVSHRDMFAVRRPEEIRRVFEASGETFDGDQFDQVWGEAQKHHSKGLVCVETFKKALREFKEKENP